MLTEAECYVVYVYFVEVTTRLKLLERTEKKKIYGQKKIRNRSKRRAIEAD